MTESTAFPTDGQLAELDRRITAFKKQLVDDGLIKDWAVWDAEHEHGGSGVTSIEHESRPAETITTRSGTTTAAIPVDRFTAKDANGNEIGHLDVASEKATLEGHTFDKGEVFNVQVDPDHQRQGVASQLLDHAQSVLPHEVKHSSSQTAAGSAFASGYDSKRT